MDKWEKENLIECHLSLLGELVLETKCYLSLLGELVLETDFIIFI